MIKRIILLLLVAFSSYGQIVRKIGYANASDVALHPQMSVGDYMVKNRVHASGNIQRFYIDQTEILNTTVSNSSGDALFTCTAHGKANGLPVGVKLSRYYNGRYKLASVTANTFKLTKLDGTTLAFSGVDDSAMRWYELFLSHDEKNFSLGVASHGKACRDKWLISSNLADFDTSPAYKNHNADGTLRKEHGNVDNYTGVIGNRLWLIFENQVAAITNSGGDALATLTAHGLPSGYVMLKKTGGSYATNLKDNYWFLEVVNANTFKFRSSTTGTYMPYIANENVTFSITIDASKMGDVDVKGNSSNIVLITNTDGQAIFRKSWESVTSYGFEMWGGMKYWRMTGEYDITNKTGNVNYQGNDIEKKYYDDLFGIEFQFFNKITNNPILNIGDGANFVQVDHIRVNGGHEGFAGIMAKTDNYPGLDAGIMEVTLHSCVVTDTHGEGAYIGYSVANTSGLPQIQHSVKLIMYNMLFLRAGVEILQAGQLYEGSRISNCVFYGASLTRHAPFFLAQSSGAQVKGRIGDVIISYCIFIGSGIQSFTSQTDRADEVNTLSKPVQFLNCAFFDSCGRLTYYNLGANAGDTPLRLDNVYVKRVSVYDNLRNESSLSTTGSIYETDVLAPLDLNGVHFDTGMSGIPLLVNAANGFQKFHYIVTENVPDIEFEAHGFEGVNVKDQFYWFRNYNPTHPLYPSAQIVRGIGEYLPHEGKYFKTITAHTSNLAPDLDATNYVQLFWDENGKRSDQSGYNGTAVSIRCPNDFRIKANTFWNLNNYGLYENMPNNNYVRYYWQSAKNNAGSPDLSTLKTHFNFKNQQESITDLQNFIGTNYFVRRVVVVNGKENFSQWILI